VLQRGAAPRGNLSHPARPAAPPRAGLYGEVVSGRSRVKKMVRLLGQDRAGHPVSARGRSAEARVNAVATNGVVELPRWVNESLTDITAPLAPAEGMSRTPIGPPSAWLADRTMDQVSG